MPNRQPVLAVYLRSGAEAVARASHTFVETLCAVGQQAEAVARIRRITAVGLSAGCSSGGEGQRKK